MVNNWKGVIIMGEGVVNEGKGVASIVIDAI